jgi:inorganic pyrophosphatase
MTQRDGNGAEQASLKVIIRQPAGNYNRYEWNEAAQALVLAERVWQAAHRLFEVATVPGTISQRGVALGVLIPADQSDSPGVVVKVRPVGLATVTRGVEKSEPPWVT